MGSGRREKSMAQEEREDMKGKVFDPRDLMSYQPGSVVSRMLVYKKAGTITLFSFSEGEGLSEHTAPYDAVVMALDGTATITLGGSPHQLGPGEMIIMPADVPHAVQAATDFTMMLVMIHAE
jgi:quercetin dioxygenase-like cupin family protein